MITLDDLMRYEDFYYVGYLIDCDGDDWVSKTEAIELLNLLNKQ